MAPSAASGSEEEGAYAAMKTSAAVGVAGVAGAAAVAAVGGRQRRWRRRRRRQGGGNGGGEEEVKGKAAAGGRQGLTLVHVSAQLEPCLTQENTPHTLNPPKHPLVPPESGLHHPYAHPLSHTKRSS